MLCCLNECVCVIFQTFAYGDLFSTMPFDTKFSSCVNTIFMQNSGSRRVGVGGELGTAFPERSRHGPPLTFWVISLPICLPRSGGASLFAALFVLEGLSLKFNCQSFFWFAGKAPHLVPNGWKYLHTFVFPLELPRPPPSGPRTAPPVASCEGW